ncbi:hypothetical protein FO519_005976 [Halicephalobus sp. NKZ332]|nr:hypothetical protein FO519_005976 [Halicephalobus sp. NKZ332]
MNFFWIFGFIFISQNIIFADPGDTVGTKLVRLKVREGEINRDADPGTQVFFDAPLRADRNNLDQVTVEIDNEAASQAFGVFPTVLSPGDPFSLVLRDSSLIPLMEGENIFEIPKLPEIFDIDSLSGFLKVKNPSLITVENLGENFEITVEVSDGKNPADVAIVKIRIISKEKENEKFEFDQPIYAFAVVPRRKSVGKLGFAEGKEGEMRITQGGSGYFEFEKDELNYHGPVERSSKNYTLEVLGFSKSDPSKIAVSTVHVLVAGIGSSSPTFKKKFETIFINEKNPPETVVRKIEAEDFDKDASLVFSLESKSCYNFLSNEIPCENEIVLHPNGEVFLKEISPELMTMLMNISVSDTNHKLEDKDYASIFITILRENPESEFDKLLNSENSEDLKKLFNFEKLDETLILDENLPVGSYVFTLVLKPLFFKNSEIFKPNLLYSLTSGKKYFKIDGESGNEKLKNIIRIDEDGRIFISEKVDFEENKKVQFFVKVTNQLEKSSTIPVSIKIQNLNDNPPVFSSSQKLQNPVVSSNASKLQYSVFDNAPIGSFIGLVDASDFDNEKLFYSLSFPEKSPLEERISITQDGILETEGFLIGLEGKFEFSIFIKDDLYSSKLDSELKILETRKCQPFFEKNQKEIFEVGPEVNAGAVIGEINSFLEDSECPEVEVKIEVLEEKEENLIKVEKNKLKLNPENDLEENVEKRVPIVISLNSGNFFARKPAEVRILKNKKNKLQYAQKNIRIEVEENKTGKILEFKRISKEKVFFKIQNNVNEIFEIEEGTLKLTKPVDKEENDFYRLKVLVSEDENFDEELSDEITINIFINDQDDNSPKFDRDSYEIVLDSTTLPGTKVLRVFAEDLDKSQKHQLLYKILSSTFNQNGRSDIFNEVFNVSKSTGEVKLVRSLKDFEGGYSSLILLLVIFILLLVLVFVIFGILVCHYRRKFEKERNEIVQAKIAAARNQKNHRREWSAYLERPPELLWERSITETTGSATPERRNSYAVQEMKVAIFS